MITLQCWTSAFGKQDVLDWAVEHHGLHHGIEVQEQMFINSYTVHQLLLDARHSLLGWIHFAHEAQLHAFCLQYGAAVNVMRENFCRIYVHELPAQLVFHGNLELDCSPQHCENPDILTCMLTVYGILDAQALCIDALPEHVVVHGIVELKAS